MADKKSTTSVEEKKPTNTGKTYHLSKRSDGKWQVKFAGGEKAIKLFDTQKDALEYTKNMAANQNRAVVVHASKGEHKGKVRTAHTTKTK